MLLIINKAKRKREAEDDMGAKINTVRYLAPTCLPTHLNSPNRTRTNTLAHTLAQSLTPSHTHSPTLSLIRSLNKAEREAVDAKAEVEEPKNQIKAMRDTQEGSRKEQTLNSKLQFELTEQQRQVQELREGAAVGVLE